MPRTPFKKLARPKVIKIIQLFQTYEDKFNYQPFPAIATVVSAELGFEVTPRQCWGIAKDMGLKDFGQKKVLKEKKTIKEDFQELKTQLNDFDKRLSQLEEALGVTRQ